MIYYHQTHRFLHVYVHFHRHPLSCQMGWNSLSERVVSYFYSSCFLFTFHALNISDKLPLHFFTADMDEGNLCLRF